MRDLQNEDSDKESLSESEDDESDDPPTAPSPLSVFSSVPSSSSLTPSGYNAGVKRELSEEEDEEDKIELV